MAPGAHQNTRPLAARLAHDPAAAVSGHRHGVGHIALLSVCANSRVRHLVDTADRICHALHPLWHSLHSLGIVAAAQRVGRSGFHRRGVMVKLYAADHRAADNAFVSRRLDIHFSFVGQRAFHVGVAGEPADPGGIGCNLRTVGKCSGRRARRLRRDFVEYWAASRLFWYGGNPYSPAELMTLQQTAGWNGAAPLIMWNPPWSLLFTLPFGLVEYATSQFLWLLVHVILILYSAQQLWRIYGDNARSSRLPWILALTFVPTLFVLIIGQITPLVLAGLTLLLYAERKQRLWTTSASLLILSIKPQVLYLFWIVFALWLLEKRPWRVVWRAALVGLAAGLVPVLFDPNIYSQYLALYGVPTVLKPMDWPVPTLRNVIRVFFDIDQMWLQLAPTILAILWAVYYWQRHKHQW